jgi:2-iminobutanoate/2-iminopropanoate deaminase
VENRAFSREAESGLPHSLGGNPIAPRGRRCGRSPHLASIPRQRQGHQAAKGWTIIDAGWMAMSRDRGTQRQKVDYGYGEVCDADGNVIEGLVLAGANQEHGIVSRMDGKVDPDLRRGFRSEGGFASCPTTPARSARSSRNIRRSPRRCRAEMETLTMAGEIVQFNPATMAAPGGHYSHSISANGFVFVSGQLPIAPDGTKLNEAPFEQQAQQVLDNVAHALKAAGSSIAGLTQVRVYVTDIEAWPAFNTLYAAWAGAARPARAVVPVPKLHYGFKIEVEAVAVKTGP